MLRMGSLHLLYSTIANGQCLRQTVSF